MGKLDNKNILMVIAADQYRDEELNDPKEIFIQEGARVTIASSTLNLCNGMFGAAQKPDILIKNARADDYDAVAVVGGSGTPKYLWQDNDLHKLLQDADSKNKVVAAICLAGAVLAIAGILCGVDVTVYETPESLEEMKKGKAKYIKQDVVSSDRIITANGPHAAKNFGTAIMERLAY